MEHATVKDGDDFRGMGVTFDSITGNDESKSLPHLTRTVTQVQTPEKRLAVNLVGEVLHLPLPASWHHVQVHDTRSGKRLERMDNKRDGGGLVYQQLGMLLSLQGGLREG